MKEVTGVHIHPNAHSDRWHVYCEYNGFRYHVAFNRRTGELEPDAAKGTMVTLYKNPLPVPDEKNLGKSRHLTRYEPGYFNTVKMDANGATGRTIIPIMLAKAKMLMEAAEAKLAVEAQAEAQRDKEQRRINRINACAAEMYALIDEAHKVLPPGSPWMKRANELRRKIEAD